MKIRIDLKIFVFVLIFIFTHQIKLYAILMLFALIHELGHLLAGVLLKFKPNKLEIMPYGLSVGFNIKCEDYNRKIKKANMLAVKRLIIAAAGPLTNLIIIVMNLLFNIDFLGIQREIIIYSNILIGLFNLIPIYPLDGGRILKEIIHIICGLEKSYRYTNLVSRVTVCLFTFICSIAIIYIRNIGVVIILSYLWYLAIIENKKYNRWHQMYKQINIKNAIN